MRPAPTSSQVELLGEIARENVTFRDYGRVSSYRLWSDERSYIVVTPRVRTLIRRGWAIPVIGGRWNRGTVELTETGRLLVSAHGSEAPID